MAKVDTAKRSHRERKNPRAAELYREQKRATNALRPKQVFVRDENGGHWVGR